MTCPRCGLRSAAKDRPYCQRCERIANPVQGPKHEPKCTKCRDQGRTYTGGCDIPGCRHYYVCECSTRVPEPHEVARG